MRFCSFCNLAQETIVIASRCRNGAEGMRERGSFDPARRDEQWGGRGEVRERRRERVVSEVCMDLS